VKVLGVDFTSTPTRRKPVTCLVCELDDGVLRADELETFASLADFEAMLHRPGPWIAGLDFPFGQSRRFIENIGWPRDWAAYVERAGALARAEFRALLDAYRAPRPPGDREHRRVTDIAAGAISPQKLYGVPLALMFHEGAPRLRAAGVAVPGLQAGDRSRTVVEAYPGALARHLIGRRSYKSDLRARQDAARREARGAIVDALRGGALRRTHGVDIDLDIAPTSATRADTVRAAALVDDPMGDRLDALLGAVQAAWAWTRRDAGFGRPPEADPLEGWIAEPTLAPSVDPLDVRSSS